MTTLRFFEKPGCGGNARQRAALEAAGHVLERRNLLTAPWTRESLLAFLWELPVPDWFNRAAPRVKSGEVNPEALSADDAIALLLAEPLLIRRPLMERLDDGTRMVGFEADAVDAWIGLHTAGRRSPGEGCASPREKCDPVESPPSATSH